MKKRSREEVCCGTEPGGGGLWVVMVVLGGISLHFMLQCLRTAESTDNYRNPQCLFALWLLSEFLAGFAVTGQAHGSELGEACFL